jgi:hypothetical protein
VNLDAVVEDEGTDGVSETGSSVCIGRRKVRSNREDGEKKERKERQGRRRTRVELSSRVTSLDVDLGEVTGTGDLNVVLRLEVVSGSNCSLRHDAGTVTRRRAPRNFVFF